MNHHEHAQQIYSLIFAGWAASGRPLPAAQEAEAYAKMAVGYAQAFAKVTKEKPDV